MADSTKVPAVGALKPSGPAAGDQSARVIELPNKLLNVARAQRLEGEVVRHNNDGSTRIRTDAGNIDVQLRGRPPETGTRVQVDIPAGNPPRQVTVRPAPSQPAPPQGQTPQPAPAQPAPQPAPPVTSQPAPARPVPVTPNMPLPPTGQTPAAPPPVTMPLPENTLVRLLPATPAQVQQAVQQTMAALTTQPAAVSQTAFTANLVAQSAPDNLVTQLLNLVRAAPTSPAMPQTPALTTPPPLQSTVLPGATFLSQPITPQTMPALLTPTAPPAGQITGLPTATGASIPFQPASAFMTPALSTATAVLPKTMSVLDGTVIKITPPLIASGPITAPGAPVSAPNASPTAITATVVGTMPQGQPLVSIPLVGGGLQHAVLQFPASNLPIGTQLQIVPAPTQPAAAPPPLTQILPLLQGVRWPVLSETFQFLQQAEPALASAMAKALPSPASPRAMPAAALLFLAAAKAGDLTAWLGDKKIEALQRLGRGNLLGRLGGDGQQMARLSAEPLSNTDWRAVPLPMLWQNEIEKITLYFKRDEESQRDQGDGEQTRFIFDLSLSRIGEMQIDGLMRGQRLDLIVRSQSPFSGPMQAHMKQLYHAAIEDVSLTGDLSFQGDPRQWVHVLQKEETYQENI